MGSSSPSNDLAEQAFRQNGAQVYRFLLRKTGDHHDAEELTQRVFAEAAETLAKQRDPPRSILSWLYTVAERRFIDEVRHRVVARRALPLIVGNVVAPDLNYNREVAAALRDRIAALPYEQRVVLVRKVINGEPFASIAADLEISVDACKMRLSRGVAKLRQELDAMGLKPE
jgi:RNA polymerase sigma factor (sigma-70 family)